MKYSAANKKRAFNTQSKKTKGRLLSKEVTKLSKVEKNKYLLPKREDSSGLKKTRQVIAKAPEIKPTENNELIKQEVTKLIKKSTVETNTSEKLTKEIVKKQSTPLKKNTKTVKRISLKAMTQKQLLKSDKEALVKVRNVDVTFGIEEIGIKAMKNISFNIYKGEVLGLVGESGSGKSTTGNAIMGLLDRQRGDITVDDVYIPHKKNKIKHSLRKQLATIEQMIFQDPANSLNSQKPIKKVISEGLDNIDIIELFMKRFDSNTLKNLLEILKNTGKNIFNKTFSSKKIDNLIDAGEYEIVHEELYVKPIDKLEKTNVKLNKKASIYLQIRLDERNFFIENKRKMKDRIINDIIESVGLSKKIFNRFPLEFSGGQQQRIGISRAVVMQPKLLVADEPISALDVSIQAQVINIFNDLKKAMDLTILFIAHDLRMVEYISDRVAVMYRGSILEIGDSKEITDNPLHPYTKTLYASVPTIDKSHTNLTSYEYNPGVHDYSQVTPKWYQVNGKEHYVFGTEEEIRRWANGKK